ncbi:IPT/TIG domain-containing protein [Candidatus Parcubacteria bacterium]|nr:IPT/TIG domain-containing protein [Candidatus Parcubacteria bacterium]
MKNKLIKFSILAIIALALFTAVDFALAQDIGIDYANNLGLQEASETDIKTLIINIIRYVLTFLGIIAVVMVMYGGFIWMTSNGQPDRIQKAKKTLIGAAIGLVIVISAFAIVTFIANITGDVLEGSCVVGDPPKACGCQDMGVKTCQVDGTWGDCSADCDYSGGERCCAWGCDTSCLVPPEFNINSTVPNDGEGNAIRNIKVIFNFNRTVDEAGFTDDKFLVEDIDSGLPIAGGRVVDGKRIIFTPEAGCGVNDCGATNCFASGQKVRVTAENGAGGILSAGGIELTCPFTGCIIEFTVGDLIDCEDPEVSLDFNQICAINNNELYAIASDDSGLSMLEFFVDDSSVLDISNPILLGGDLFVNTRDSGNPVWWDASAIDVGTSVTIRVDANDIDNHFGSDSETFKLRPAHCCNDILDGDEEGVDCGGSCAGCEGAACGISLFESCSEVDSTNCDDSLCSSGLCACTSFGDDTECAEAGYSGDITDCCICQDAPIIDYISPIGGFCSSTVDVYCGDDDTVCDDIVAGDICDIETANASAGSLVTIGGRYFGEYDPAASKVEFDGVTAQLADAVNANCTDNWTANQIIVVLPNGLPDNSIVKVTANSGYYDTNDDDNGSKIKFIVNNIERPGLCKLENLSTGDNTGVFEDELEFQGINLNNNSAFFGSYSSNVAGINSVFGALSGTSLVPNLNKTGKITVFSQENTEKVNSNYLEFIKKEEIDPGPYILSFTPKEGAVGQYITIMGGGFGSSQGNSKVYFDLDPNNNDSGDSNDYGVLASFDFPEICADYLWSDNQILIKAPDDLPTDKENYFIVIDLLELNEPIDTGDDFHTGPVADPRFFYDSDLPLAPSLCKIDPARGPNNSEISLWGEYFGEYNPDGSSKVVFYNDKIQSGPLAANGIISWETNDEVDEIRTAVHSEAITGPVVVIKNGDLAGNSLNFNVGECGINSDCDNGGVAGVCCPAESTEAGRCAVDKNSDGNIDIMDCYISLSSSVYEWEFTSGDGGAWFMEPCYDGDPDGVCEEEDGPCNNNFVCDSCVCKLPCDGDVDTVDCDIDHDICSSFLPYLMCDEDCFCIGDALYDSCQGKARNVNACDPDPCPNSSGLCSPFLGEEKIDSGISCGDDSCVMVGCDPITCAYDILADKCYNKSILCSKIVSDIFGNDVKAYCASYGDPAENRWHINTNASCPVGWFSIGNNRCVKTGIEGICEPCPLGLSCMDINGDNNGECMSSFDICPGGHNCEVGSCVKDDDAACECCCRNPGTGEFDAQDCCSPLSCAGDCGEDREIDTDSFGYCIGCRVENPDGSPNYALSDQACNCEEATGKFCDVNYEIDGVKVGACKDCAQLELDATECSIHSTVCCVDGMDGNYCRGVGDGSSFDNGLFDYCAYYNCLEPDNDSCDINPQTSGDYDAISDCEEFCIGNLTDNLGESCESEKEDDCNVDICPNPFGCINEDGSGPFYPDDCGICCCDPGSVEDECQLAGYPSLNCAADSDPCDGENRGLCCGCSIDSDCSVGIPLGVGCGDDTCCRARPQVESHIPADIGREICRNAEIVVNFNQKMDTGSFKGNVILIGDYEFDQCPEGTEYLALDGRQSPKRNFAIKFFLRAKHAFKKVFKYFSSPDSAYAYDAVQAGHNFCAISGQTSGYNNVAGKGILRFQPRQLLDGDRIYYAIIKGDENLSDDRSEGVKNIWDIGMNGGINETFNGIFYANTYIFSFEVLSEQADNNGVCIVDHINVEPSSYLFQTNVNNQNDDNPADTNMYDNITDSDKVFVAYALDDTNQVLAPVEGVYDWNLIWNSNNVLIADVVPVVPEIDDQKIIRAGTTKTEGEAVILAAMEYVNNSIGAPLPAPGTADVYLFVCENPWPPFKDDGTWEPWQDIKNNCSISDQGCDYGYNFKLYYCRDAGNTGTYDDLPAIYSGQEATSDNTVIRGESSVLICSIDGEYCPPASAVNDVCGFEGKGKCQRSYLKEVYFFREESPTASTSFEVVNGLDGTSAIISWNKILSGVDGYKIYWGTASNNYIDYAEIYNDGNDDHENMDCEETGASITCVLSELTGETLYYFNLSSFLNTGTESEYFGEKSVFITDKAAPNPPVNFNAIPGDGQVALSWDETESAVGYKLYYGISSGVYGGSEDVGDDTSIILSGLTNGSVYYFAVTAYDEYGNESNYSLEKSGIPVTSDCGDSVCDAISECSNCGADCDLGDCCGNGDCDTAIGENEGNCDDCNGDPPPPPPPPPVTCGNGVCDLGEDVVNCPADCGGGAVCGDGVCDASECSACVADCSPADCCPNGVCDAVIGEDEGNCSDDCGGVPPPPPPPPPPA